MKALKPTSFLSFFFLLLLRPVCLTQCPPPGLPVAGDNCPEAAVICDDIDGYCGVLDSNNVVQTFPGCPSNVLNNDEWIVFVAGSSTIEIEVHPSNCQGTYTLFGMQAAILEGYCNGPAIATQCGCTEDPFVLASDSFHVGQAYYLLLDGCAGDICDYDLSVTAGNTIPLSPPPPGGIAGPVLACPGGTAQYSVTNPGAAVFDWTLSPPGIGSFVGSAQGNSVHIQWNAIGSGTICVSSSNACFFNPDSVCTVVNISTIPTVSQEHIVCIGDCVECAGQLFCSPGVFPVTLNSYLGCDSVINCVIDTVQPPAMTNLGQVTLCRPAEFSICDTVLTNTGNYCDTCESWLGCDSIVCVDLVIPDPQAIIAQPDTLNCGEMIILDGSQSTFFLVPGGITSFKWTGPPGGISGPDDQPTVTVSLPGEYALVLTHSINNVFCSDTAFAMVEQAELTNLGGDQHLCEGDTLILDAGPGFATYAWNTNDSTQTIEVTSAGTYAVTVSNFAGCTDADSVTVTFHTAPTVNLGPDTLLCAENLPFVLDAGPDFAIYAWSTGDSTQTIEVTSAGTYAVTVSNFAGCTDADSVTVTFHPAPTVNLGPDTLICAENLPFVLDAGPGFATYAWSTGDSTQTLLVADSTSTYFSVTVTDANGCTAIDSVFIEVTVCNATHEPALPGQLTLRPNPAAGYVYFYFENFEPGDYQISFSDVTGRWLKVEQVRLSATVQTVPMDLAPLGSGIYFVKVASGKGVMVKRLAVQR